MSQVKGFTDTLSQIYTLPQIRDHIAQRIKVILLHGH